MDAVHMMRAFTERDLIIKVEGCYHGHHDSVQVSVLPDADDEIGPTDARSASPGNSGIPAAIRDLVIVVSSTTWPPSSACSRRTRARSRA